MKKFPWWVICTNVIDGYKIDTAIHSVNYAGLLLREVDAARSNRPGYLMGFINTLMILLCLFVYVL